MPGIAPPPTLIDAKAYTDSGLPWFALYDESAGDVPVSERLSEVKTIAARDVERGVPNQGEAPLDVSEAQIRTVRRDNARATQTSLRRPRRRSRRKPVRRYCRLFGTL